MTSLGFFDALPLWLLFLLTVGFVLLSLEIGYRLGRRRRERGGPVEGPVDASAGAILGLLAFMPAFIFGMAATRDGARSAMIVQEAGVIGAAYRQADFLSNAEREQAQALLREYASLRVGKPGVAGYLERRAKAEQVLDRLWQASVRASGG
jgi:hypothetical protein